MHRGIPKLREGLSEISDKRQQAKIEYNLVEVLIISLLRMRIYLTCWFCGGHLRLA